MIVLSIEQSSMSGGTRGRSFTGLFAPPKCAASGRVTPPPLLVKIFSLKHQVRREYFDPGGQTVVRPADGMDREEVSDGGRQALPLNWLKLTRVQKKNWKKWSGREMYTPVLRGAVSPSQPQRDDDDDDDDDDDRHLPGY